MSKKVLILSGSPRKGGNSDLLCDEFMRGAEAAGNEVEKIRAAEKKIGYCSACYYCAQSGGICAKKDDMAEVLQKMIDADVIVLASPVYFYSIDAQLKTVMDRTVARWLEVTNKEFYYLVTCADGERESQERTIECFRGYADCVEGGREMGIIYGTGVYQKGEIKNSAAFEEAYKMGRSVC
ncbi:MAG: flavodoxin family protein [Oscillospiraceae bacterium]|nr:flavodoxin family protein [Oscillospiraceae bacterium]